uniref:type IX secretion system sortase PorU n=1 Tax=Aureivirga marina TaxID=1182451 RepID=UPI0018CB2F61|nr:type IX secretion system sortase PorU [Aureivirga marina]
MIQIAFSQRTEKRDFNLEWEENKLIHFSDKRTINSPVIKGHSLDFDFIPSYSEQWKIQNGLQVKSAELTNITYETLSPNVLQNIDKNKIPTEAKFELVAKKRRNQTFLIFQLTPIINVNGNYQKITSFSLDYELESKRNNPTFRTTNSSNSVLANGTWYKFAVDTSGVFKIDRGFMESLGINMNEVNPKNIRIYGNGGKLLPNRVGDFRHDDLQENAIFVSGEDDGIFNNEDYILFYAQGPHSWNDNEISSTFSLRHQQNIYSDFAYYYITVDNGQGRRIVTSPEINQNAVSTITTFDDYTFYEREDYNITTLGTKWLGEPFNIENDQTFHIPFENIDNQITVRVAMVSQSPTNSSARIYANNENIFNLSFGTITSSTLASEETNSRTITASGNAVSVNIDYNNNGNPSARGYLDYIEIYGKKKLISTNKQFSFRSFEAKNTNGVVTFQIQNATNLTSVWDVTNHISPAVVPLNTSGSSKTFKANGNELRQYVALENNDYYTPTLLNTSLVPNQNLHSLENIEYLIVTSNELVNQAERLANYHQTNSNLNSVVVPLDKIYNEFSSGSPDITGIRDFVKHLYESNTDPNKKLKYLCLFGDTSYDYKNRIIDNNNIVPSLETEDSYSKNSYVSDDYYVMLDDDEGKLTNGRLSIFDQLDVSTGRIIVTTNQQAQNVVDKILSYYSKESLGKWRNDISLVADDIDELWEAQLQDDQEEIAQRINNLKPQLNIKKIFADSYVQEISSGGERYPDVNKAISDAIEKGTLMIDYFGHGGEDGWAHERILELSEINNLNNPNTLPLFVTITCEFTKFDNPERDTAGEFTFWNKNGGAVSLITTTRSIAVNTGAILNERIMDKLVQIEENDLSIANILLEAKNSYANYQKYYAFFIGDPAMRLAVPKPNIKITSLNGKDISQPLDSLKALSHPIFEGVVTDNSGNILSDFNGEVYATIYDKAVDKTTLDNGQNDIVLEYKSIESKIFTGRASVTNGKFTFDFIVPRDIKIAYGKGKLSFYAHNNTPNDKSGYNLDVTVGGVNENAPEDNQGPKIKLYMNDETFIDGGTTNQSPLFLALLEDENGINTSFTAVDHDIVAFLDGDQNNPIILNDFYETELDSYKEGRVKYPFKDLKTGQHTLTLKVWDTYNNSSEATLNFFVTQDIGLSLTNVLNYPNPFVNYTEFWFTHNRPNEQLETQVQIFTVSGKLVKTINQIVQTEGFLARSITWDGLDDFGDKIGKGVYVYKLKVKSLVDGSSAEKYEKLVILQ